MPNQNQTQADQLHQILEYKNSEVGSIMVAIQPDTEHQDGKINLVIALNKPDYYQTHSKEFNHYSRASQAIYNLQPIIAKIINELDHLASTYYIEPDH